MIPAFVHSVPAQVSGPDRKGAKGGLVARSPRVIPDARHFASRSRLPACRPFNRLKEATDALPRSGVAHPDAS